MNNSSKHLSSIEKDEIENLLKVETKTRNEAQYYITENLRISRTIYYDWIHPLIEDEFFPLFENNKEDKSAGYRITKNRLDEIIAHFKKDLIDRIKEVSDKKSF